MPKNRKVLLKGIFVYTNVVAINTIRFITEYTENIKMFNYV